MDQHPAVVEENTRKNRIVGNDYGQRREEEWTRKRRIARHPQPFRHSSLRRGTGDGPVYGSGAEIVLLIHAMAELSDYRTLENQDSLTATTTVGLDGSFSF